MLFPFFGFLVLAQLLWLSGRVHYSLARSRTGITAVFLCSIVCHWPSIYSSWTSLNLAPEPQGFNPERESSVVDTLSRTRRSGRQISAIAIAAFQRIPAWGQHEPPRRYCCHKWLALLTCTWTRTIWVRYASLVWLLLVIRHLYLNVVGLGCGSLRTVTPKTSCVQKRLDYMSRKIR